MTTTPPHEFPERYRGMVAEWRGMGLDDTEIAERIECFQQIDDPADQPTALAPLTEHERELALKLIAERRTLTKAAVILLLSAIVLAVPVAVVGFWLDGYLIHFFIPSLIGMVIAGTFGYYRRTVVYSLLCGACGVLHVLMMFFFDDLMRVTKEFGAGVTWEFLRHRGFDFFSASVSSTFANPKISAMALFFGGIMFFACRPSLDDGNLRAELQKHHQV
jgi:hypothetical protein